MPDSTNLFAGTADVTVTAAVSLPRVPGRAPPCRTPGRMNRTEARYAAHLELCRVAGELAGWWFEGITLKLAHDCRLTPDFLVQLADGALELHDVKSRWTDGQTTREDAKVKLRVAAGTFPFRVRAAVWESRTKTWTWEDY